MRKLLILIVLSIGIIKNYLNYDEQKLENFEEAIKNLKNKNWDKNL